MTSHRLSALTSPKPKLNPKWLSLLGLAILALALATACTKLASPEGWAGPVVTSNNMVLSTPEKGKLAAFDLSQNRLAWQFPSSNLKHPNDKKIELEAIYTTPIVSQQTAFIGGYDGYVYALDMSNGVVRWEFKSDGPIVGGLLMDGTTLYFGTADGGVYALNAADGAAKWARPFEADGRIWARPTLDQGVLYVTTLEGDVFALNAENGAANGNHFEAKAGIPSPVVVSQGKVLVGSMDSTLYALDPSLKNVLWEFKADNWFWTEPLVNGNTVYTGSLDGKMYAVDLNSGGLQWERNLGEPIRAKAALSQGVLVVLNGKGEAWGLNPQTGDPAWPTSVALGEDVLADPFLSGDNIYVNDTNGGLHGLKVIDGSLVPVPDLKALV